MKRIIVATIVACIALSATAVGAQHYLISSTKQLSPKVVKQLRGHSGPEGREGPQGPAGAQGPAGPANLSQLNYYEGPKEYIGEEVGSSVATCPAGQHAVSGGGSAITLDGMAVSEPSEDHQSWYVIAAGTSENSTVQAEVNCAGAGAAVAAGTNSKAHARAVAEAKALVARIKAAR